MVTSCRDSKEVITTKSATLEETETLHNEGKGCFAG